MTTRTRRSTALILPILALASLALPAAAEVFFVDLVNGSTFETRYKPMLADWDESKVIVITSVGNRITLLKEDIDQVRIDTEMRGFGRVIDTTTIALGQAPNDAPEPGQQDPSAQLLDYLQARDASRSDFTVQQFVTTENAGQGGLPAAGWGGYSGFSGGGGGFGRDRVVPVPGGALGGGPGGGPDG